MHLPKASLFAFFLVAAACSSSDNGTTETPADGPDGGSDTPAASSTIYDVQSDAMPVDTRLTVENVVVTAIDTFGGRKGAIYVQDPQGGPFSGVAVNAQNAPAGMVVGSIVTVTGFKDEFALDADTTGRTVTQIGSPTITVTGSGEVPAAELLDPRALAADEVEAEKWEGVLVRFDNVAFEGLPRGVTESDDTLWEARVTGPFRVQSALAEFPAAIGYRDCYASITGIGDYFFDYKILPRSAADFSGGGSDCPAAEAMCLNSEDDDADGFSDCSDFDCFAADAALGANVCASDVSIIDIQGDIVELDAIVEVVGKVTAMGRDRDEVWVQSLGSTGADHDGLHVEVFRSILPGQELDGDIEVGSEVRVIGLRRDSWGETIVTNAFLLDEGSVSAPFARTDATLGHIADASSAAPFEGQLVTFSAVEVSDVGDYGQFTISDGSNELLVDDSLFNYDQPSVNDTMTVTGIVMLNTFDDAYYLAPRMASDIE